MEFNATFLVSAISFIVFVFIMNAICYKPIEQIVEQRQKFIDDTNLAAKINMEKSDSLLKNKEETISQSKQDAKKFIADRTAEAQQIKSDMKLDAQAQVSEKIQKAKAELQESKNQAHEMLLRQYGQLADEISAKILG